MTGPEATRRLIRAVERGAQVPSVLPHFRALLDAAVEAFNQLRSPRSLVRLATELIPTHPLDITAVRGRMGTLIELGLADLLNGFIQGSGFPRWRISVNYVTEYPNLYLRDENGAIRLRIETKALHDEAEEGAARFDTLTPYINQFLDVLIVVGWRWARVQERSVELVYPAIFAADALSAIELARERDTRFRMLGGVFRAGGRPYVHAKRRGRPFVSDPGNYGKLNRIVHPTRRPEDLAQDTRRFLQLLQTIYPQGRGRGARPQTPHRRR